MELYVCVIIQNRRGLSTTLLGLLRGPCYLTLTPLATNFLRSSLDCLPKTIASSAKYISIFTGKAKEPFVLVFGGVGHERTGLIL